MISSSDNALSFSVTSSCWFSKFDVKSFFLLSASSFSFWISSIKEFSLSDASWYPELSFIASFFVNSSMASWRIASFSLICTRKLSTSSELEISASKIVTLLFAYASSASTKPAKSSRSFGSIARAFLKVAIASSYSKEVSCFFPSSSCLAISSLCEVFFVILTATTPTMTNKINAMPATIILFLFFIS